MRIHILINAIIGNLFDYCRFKELNPIYVKKLNY